MTAPRIGVVLAGRYRLDGVLGVGGSAIVYRAWDEQLSRFVAVKVLNQDSEDPAHAQRHQLELTTLARLTHPGLVTVYAGQTTSDQQPGFIVLELVEGGSLASRLRLSPWTVPAVLRIGELLADALAYIHERGIVHRDVKPGNVLLAAYDHPKLTDFGILRSDRHEALTQPGTAIGTAAYLSPEQVLGRDVDGASDVYSLALVLLEALTGRRSYEGLPLESALARLERQPEIPTWLPVPVAQLLASMTARDPLQRPSAASVSARIRHLDDAATHTPEAPAISEAEPVSAAAPTTTLLLRQQRRVRRPKRLGAGLLAICLAGLALDIARGGAVAADAPITGAGRSGAPVTRNATAPVQYSTAAHAVVASASPVTAVQPATPAVPLAAGPAPAVASAAHAVPPATTVATALPRAAVSRAAGSAPRHAAARGKPAKRAKLQRRPRGKRRG